MTPADAETSGTGGGLRYLTEEACPDVVAQEQSHSCQVACARQLLIDAGVTMTETELAERIEYHEGSGTDAKDIAALLTRLHPNDRFMGGTIEPEFLESVTGVAPWIASVKTLSGSRHAVIVDKVANGIVHIRDPWGLFGPGSSTGSRATMELGNFHDHWRAGFHLSVFRQRTSQGAQS